MKLTGAEITIKLLELEGVKIVSGIPGGFNLPLYDALANSNIQHILARHEQGAAFIAQGISRSTDNIGVCFATSGPGVTNLLTAIADAKLDSVPLIAITGQVPLNLIGTDAFQEVDTYGLTIPITKHNFLVHSAKELFNIIPEAFNIAKEGRPGPVVIDIPKNVQTEVVEFESWPTITFKKEKNCIDNLKLSLIAEEINNSKKPVLYIGGGILLSNSNNDILKLAEKNSIPIASTLMALGSIPYNHKLNLGMFGMHGAPYSNNIVNNADLILAFGVRFDDRATGNISKFSPNAKIIHIDIDAAEINKIKKAFISLNADIKEVLAVLLPMIEYNKRESWINEIEIMKKEYPFPEPNKENTMHPINIIKSIGNLLSKDAIIVTDVGQHQMWTAQAYPFRKPKTLLTSGGLGTMGFGLPAAIGAALVNPNKDIVCFSGDGSILMNIQELATLADYNLNIKIIILNNGHLGLVRQQQELLYKKNYIASKFISSPDFSLIAEGFNIKGYNLESATDPIEALANILSSKGPAVINIPINPDENVFPIVPPGSGNTEMIIGGGYND